MKNAIRNSFQKVQMHEQVSPQMVMSIMSDIRPREEEGETQQLSFSDKDLQGMEIPHNDVLVITLKIATRDVKRVLIDPGSSSEIMYMNLYRSFNNPPQRHHSSQFPIV